MGIQFLSHIQLHIRSFQYYGNSDKCNAICSPIALNVVYFALCNLYPQDTDPKRPFTVIICPHFGDSHVSKMTWIWTTADRMLKAA